ncbi:MAG: hypothetical protein OHK0017_01780 [Patescibacteria group bacterium]
MRVFFRRLTQLLIVTLGIVTAVMLATRVSLFWRWNLGSFNEVQLSNFSSILTYFVIPVLGLSTLLCSSIFEFVRGVENKDNWELLLSSGLFLAATILFLNYNIDTNRILQYLLKDVLIIYLSAVFAWIMLFVEILNFYTTWDFEELNSIN